MDIESMARYWSQDAENYGNIIQDELASFRVEAWQKLLREKRKFGAVDERFLREGEALLFGELAVALDIAPEAVPAYIQARLELTLIGCWTWAVVRPFSLSFWLKWGWR